jgi:hypothetical protein
MPSRHGGRWFAIRRARRDAARAAHIPCIVISLYGRTTTVCSHPAAVTSTSPSLAPPHIASFPFSLDRMRLIADAFGRYWQQRIHTSFVSPRIGINFALALPAVPPPRTRPPAPFESSRGSRSQRRLPPRTPTPKAASHCTCCTVRCRDDTREESAQRLERTRPNSSAMGWDGDSMHERFAIGMVRFVLLPFPSTMIHMSLPLF